MSVGLVGMGVRTVLVSCVLHLGLSEEIHNISPL